MTNIYEIKISDDCLSQIKKLDEKAKEIIYSKIKLLESNPFHFKRLTGFNKPLFRIRFKSQNLEKRLVFVVDGNLVKLICILDRKHDYNDLAKYFEKNKLF